ncbi:MAG: class I poly(R)-hydroxyalkanoic acid synthase [Hyphomicrobiaceae bacterium]
MQKETSKTARSGDGSKTTPPFGSDYTINDPEAFARNLLRLWEESSRAIATYLERADAKMGPYSNATELTEAAKTVTDIARHWASDPARLAEAQGSLVKSYAELWNASLRRMMGQPTPPVIQPEPGDNRFRDPEWTENHYFDFLKQAYLLSSRWSETMLERTDTLDERAKQKAEFYLRLITSSLSPSNFPLTNPEVLRETLQSNAENLVKGMHNLAADMERSGDLLKISQTDVGAFEVGRNIAVTPGKVVFQNDVLQLIQYTPTTDKAFARPLLIVPPWINKFYILDLTAEKSFIKFAVDQGFTVFVVSWVNPDERLSHKTFEDYMKEGILAAADAVKRETGEEKCNVLGYCVGGTLLATTLGYCAARGLEPFESATFLAAQIDFSKAGDLLVFIDDAQLKSLEEMMSERGYLDGSRMATVFNMMRPKDLIWPYIVNNYLLGKNPFPFDLLYWNQDSTRMPAANHKYYLREFYHENKLAKGQLQVGGVRIDMSKVKLPVYELATREDHIAPAQSVFIGARLLGGPVRFVLAGSGHIAGVVNPPGKVKYQHWTNDHRAATLESWIEGASEHPGSWWPDWAKWLGGHSGGKIASRRPGAKLGVIEDAPGSYVKAKS